MRIEATVRTGGSQQVFGCLGGVALIAAVVAAVSGWMLLSGQPVTRSLHSVILVATPVGGLAAAVFGVWAWRIWKQSKCAFVLEHDGTTFQLRIEPGFHLTGPFRVTYGWLRMSQGIKYLWCDVSRDDELLVRLTHELGTLNSPPDGWPEAGWPTRQALHGGYACPVVVEVAAMIEKHSA